MIRLALWIIASLMVTAALAWLIGLPGIVTLELAGYRMQPRLGTAIAIVLMAMLIVIVISWLVGRILGAPRYFARRAREARKARGIDTLSEAFIALEGGDPARARMLAREARVNLPANSAARLLEARADLALGDMPAAREHYRALIADRQTALAALAGLYEQARTQGRGQAALTFARKAVALAPSTPWAVDAVFDDLTGKGKWGEALAMVVAELAPTRADRARKRRRQAVLETAQARALEPTDPLPALEHALRALKLLPDFVPAALIAARIHSNRGETRRAMSLLRRVWRGTAHPDVATLYAHAQPGASALERLRRVRELVDVPPADRNAAIVLARAAIDAYEWALARNALASFAAGEPTQAVCSLMAEIEEGQDGDQGKAREWLARAVRAPRDPVWTADGVVADEWEPTSPITGKLDAFQWKVPVTALAAPARPAASGPATRPADNGAPAPAGALALPEAPPAG